ncbi:MAG TPA: PQQ-binding-like beta-propeller repeat protein [Vicinamibacterales bacterium]|nr:PQQ-binding-like beta-propeller repeat protein [Vicinamibacterales bacterium]
MSMFRKILKVAAFGIAALFIAIAVTGVLYLFFGLRVELDGGGRPHLMFVESAASRAATIAHHREAQRAQFSAASSPQAAEPEPVPPPADQAPPPESDEPAPKRTVSARPRPYWTDFRGPSRDGHYRERPVRTDWPAGGLTPLWKQPIGAGYASFVVARGRAFTIEQRGSDEVVAAYDVPTGRELWTNSWRATFSETLGGDGPRATPTWADGRVYALGGQGELRCLDEADGRVVWRTNILEENGATNLQWGMAASPLVVDDTLILLPGGPNGRSVVAYDRRTGSIAWSALGDQQAYSSPMLVTLAGVRQLLVFSSSRLMGLTPDRGELLWEYSWTTQFGVHAGQPLVLGDNRVFLSSGYGTGAAVIELTPEGNRFSVREVWRNNRMKNQFTSSVLHEGFIYGLDESILACLDANTGELKWKGGRYGYGQALLADGHLIVLTEDGDLALVRATPERHQEITRFKVLSGKTWNHPAMADGYLWVRNGSEMAAFDLRTAATKATRELATKDTKTTKN